MPSEKSGQPGRKPAAVAPPPPPNRRSRRQERIARRHPERELARASTSGKAGGPNIMLIATAIAIVAAVAIIAVAILRNPVVTGPGNIQSPPYVTSASIPQSGQNGRTLGDPNAKVTMAIWSDYECPVCGMLAREAEPAVVDKYVKSGQVKLEYHDYLVIDLNYKWNQSRDAANAARCAGDQGKYWQFHDWLFGNQQAEGSQQFTIDRLVEFAKQASPSLGMDEAKLESCIRNGTHNSDVSAESSSSPVNATPGIFLNGSQVSYSGKDALMTAIDQAIAKAASASPSPAPSASGS